MAKPPWISDAFKEEEARQREAQARAVAAAEEEARAKRERMARAWEHAKPYDEQVVELLTDLGEFSWGARETKFLWRRRTHWAIEWRLMPRESLWFAAKIVEDREKFDGMDDTFTEYGHTTCFGLRIKDGRVYHLKGGHVESVTYRLMPFLRRNPWSDESFEASRVGIEKAAKRLALGGPLRVNSDSFLDKLDEEWFWRP